MKATKIVSALRPVIPIPQPTLDIDAQAIVDRYAGNRYSARLRAAGKRSPVPEGDSLIAGHSGAISDEEIRQVDSADFFRYIYPGDTFKQAGDALLIESKVLSDKVIFASDNAELNLSAKGTYQGRAVYRASELERIRDDKLSPDMLRFLQQTKKLCGGEYLGAKPDPNAPASVQLTMIDGGGEPDAMAS